MAAIVHTLLLVSILYVSCTADEVGGLETAETETYGYILDQSSATNENQLEQIKILIHILLQDVKNLTAGQGRLINDIEKLNEKCVLDESLRNNYPDNMEQLLSNAHSVQCRNNCVRATTRTTPITTSTTEPNRTAHLTLQRTTIPTITPTTTTPAGPRDCQEVYTNGGTTSGVYTIYVNGTDEVQVYCEQTERGGGWTVFQRRKDGSVDFYLNWESYKQGFGNASGEYWIGLDYLHQLTANQSTQLLVELQDDGVTMYAPYTEFWVLNEATNYTLHVSGYTGLSDPGDSLMLHNNQRFSTKDRDHDTSSGNCAQSHYGAWWYRDCYHSELNGGYNDTNHKCIKWYTWKWASLQAARMMLKPQ